MAEWWRGSVTYQVYPRSFQDSDGDGIGDIAGITRRLDHIAGLGVDAVWLSPVFASPQGDMGYDVSDYRAIDPLFGTMADFETLIARAHDLGLKVIVDQVISHSSDQHPAFVDSRASRTGPKADWYVWADAKPDGSPPNNWMSVFGGTAWEWDSRRRQYYFHNFLPSQPDFNFHNPEVQDWHLANLRFWLDRGVDGFRLDTVNYYFHDPLLRNNRGLRGQVPANPYDMQDQRHSKSQPENPAFLERLRALTDEYPDRAMVGEVGDNLRAVELMAEYTTGKRLHMAYSFEMLGPQFTPAHFRKAITAFFRDAPGGWPCWAFSNHDVIRHTTRWQDHAADPEALARQAAAMLLSFPGSVCLYQGEEIGQTETDLRRDEIVDPPGLRLWPDYKGRDGCRTPMVWDATRNGGFTTGKPWLPVKAPQLAHNVAAQETAPESVLNFYRQMLAFRRSRPELRAGGVEFLRGPRDALLFARDGLVCAFNLGAAEISLRLDGQITGPVQAASQQGGRLRLGQNGFAFLDRT